MAIILLVFWGIILAVIIGGGFLLFTGIKQKSYIKIVLGSPAIILVMLWAYSATTPPKPEEAFRNAFLIEMPESVTFEIVDSTIKLKGPKGEVERILLNPKVKIEKQENKVVISAKNATKRDKTIIGTFKAHIKNMIKGVTEGHIYRLKICSGHFPMNVSMNNNELAVKNFLGEKKIFLN